MKRSPMPSRKTPLKQASCDPKDGQPKAKRRTTGRSAGRTAVQILVPKRSKGDCEIRTKWCLGKATNLSHRRHQGQGGKWAAQNILDSCGHGNATGCHGYLHQHPEEARAKGWVVSAFGPDPADVEVLMWHNGRQDWFLLREDGTAVLAEFPSGDRRHPDDIEQDRGLDGVA